MAPPGYDAPKDPQPVELLFCCQPDTEKNIHKVLVLSSKFRTGLYRKRETNNDIVFKSNKPQQA